MSAHEHTVTVRADHIELRTDGYLTARIDRPVFAMAKTLQPGASRLALLRTVLQWAQLCGHIAGVDRAWLAALADVSLALESAGLI